MYYAPSKFLKSESCVQIIVPLLSQSLPLLSAYLLSYAQWAHPAPSPTLLRLLQSQNGLRRMQSLFTSISFLQNLRLNPWCSCRAWERQPLQAARLIHLLHTAPFPLYAMVQCRLQAYSHGFRLPFICTAFTPQKWSLLQEQCITFKYSF